MKIQTRLRRRGAIAALAAVGTLLAGCGGSSGGSSSASTTTGTTSNSSGKTTKISFLVDNGDGTVAMAKAVTDAFHAAHPNITVDVQTRPGGGDGDNIVKTRLSTGDMADVFQYNNGSLLQPLKPAQTLVPVDAASWTSDLDKNFVDSTTVDGKLYGSPWGPAFGGGILYNIPVYKKLGLQIPQTWAQFMANSAKIKAAGIAPVIQTYGDTWTSQLIVLGDYHNVEATTPDWATKYSNGQIKYATDPAALRSFQHLEDLHKAGYFNKDYRSAKLNDGLKELATGTGAQYPMLGSVVAGIEQQVPGKINDVGFFPVPGDSAATNGLTIWPANGIYIPKTTKGDKLAAAKEFQAFFATKAACDALTKGQAPTGPYMSKQCTLPADVTQVTKDTTKYITEGKASTALEFKSPVKGPNLEKILIQVGSGIESAQKGAQDYDQDVRKQAQQLGLSWAS
ncbi:carbohydrate ABC transporter substrate-binding protein (CUT1 family) [Motilibacter rhizosphaerae]|uniref:Carbohydrate ABC transporter substrate-binding protein (CUT1 family) n=1 Tax=Motilibacter rhizosphaerae TaxID=598652 RepID=A0A4Q7NV79_9ACTN|nr:extracellular solute-binding protein [Motilibacter rhizosphaerae]RZS91141.1 carbohydrate ABC transporter substrate-binding protein (CUT1 family) [Motilibacter rhizosphaerae]